ncbi:MAG: CDC27 family protein [Pirellulaceae bacterium]|jgi:tetratricopeptide (TPR) repeat protein|nr:CDC27 family protein [Pirellulaceae bacterium]
MNQQYRSLCVVALCLATACHRPTESVPGPSGPSAAVAPQQDFFRISLDHLGRLDEFDPKQGMVQTAYYLNRWIQSTENDPAWQADPMLDELPAELRAIAPVQELAKREFTVDDVRYLREASWARSISEWVARQPEDPDLATWFKELEKARGEPHAYELSLATRLFDWTVRNIQLDALLPFPDQPAGPAGKTQPGGASKDSPLKQAMSGPGYTAFPWQTLLYGRGDAWLRARIFMLLCRQQQIDAVMLAWDDPRVKPRPRPWLPAALIDDQLYLFDTELGLPIRGPNGSGIATLAQVRQERGLLRSLDVGQDTRYAAADADFAQLVALLDAPPEALSYRIQAFQQESATGKPLFVSVSAAALAKRVKGAGGVAAVDLWRAPFQTWVYRTALRARAEVDPEALRQVMFDEMIFDTIHPLVQGRIQYFRGNFEKTPDNPGAKGYFVDARVPDVMINQIETSPEVQAGLGIFRTRENDQEWQFRIQMSKSLIIGIKHTATYWLGITHYDTGRFETAVDWLKQRTLDSAGDNAWKPGARYNLSRTYEALGDLEAARKTLLLDDSPQKHGNLLRARYLREKLERQTKPLEAGQ